jgi:hypothetical protein
MAHLEGATLPFESSPSPTDLEKSRQVHLAPIAQRTAPMLDLFTLTVILTEQTTLQPVTRCCRGIAGTIGV